MSKSPSGTLILRDIAVAGVQSSNRTTFGSIVEKMESAGRWVAEETMAIPIRASKFPELSFETEVFANDLISIYAKPEQDTKVSVQAWKQSSLNAPEVLVSQGIFEFTQSASNPSEAETSALGQPVQDNPEAPKEEAELKEFSYEMVPALQHHLKTCFEESYDDLLSETELAGLTETLSSSDVGGMLVDDSRAQLVVTLGDQIIGSLMCASRHNITYVWGMYVRKDHQRKGIGQGLLQAMAATLPDKGMVELTVLEASEPAVQFYQTMGFKGHRSGDIEFVPGKTLKAKNMFIKVDAFQAKAIA